MALRKDDTQEALELATAALEKAPQHELASGVLVGALVKFGESDEALTRINDALAASPESVPLHLLKLELLKQNEDIDGVAKVYGELFLLQPDEPGLRLELADFYWRRDEFEQAEAVVRQAIADDLVTQETLDALMRIVRHTKGAAGAETELQQLIARNPDNHLLRAQLAGLYILRRPDGRGRTHAQRNGCTRRRWRDHRRH